MGCGSPQEREAIEGSGRCEKRRCDYGNAKQSVVRRGQRVAGGCCDRSRPSANIQSSAALTSKRRDCNLDRRRTGTTSQAQHPARIDSASERTVSARGTARMHASSAFSRLQAHVNVRRLPFALALGTGVGILPRVDARGRCFAVALQLASTRQGSMLSSISNCV